MSNEKRSYEMKERARRRAETQGRIVEATLSLHGEVGPAATTVADIARRAGVSRLTVYNHFPTDAPLFAACQQHFLTRHPPPDLSSAFDRSDPLDRVGAVLNALYASYRERAPVTEKVLRDRSLLPALDALLEKTLDAQQARIISDLTEGFTIAPEAVPKARALVALAIDFFTWERLTRQGLDDEQAAQLMTELVGCIS